jgi:predicted ATPase/class 3 adenylate cyclase/DNA-binding SARP family transcriptional activator
MDFRILGPFEVTGTAGGLELRGVKRRSLLAYLVTHPGQPISADRLVSELWRDGGSGAVRTVQTYVSQLRRLLDGEDVRLDTRPGGYVLEVDPTTVDASRFERAVTAAGTEADAARRLALLDGALELWRGRPLGEFEGTVWADREATWLEALRLQALQRRCDALIDLGRAGEAAAQLEGLVRIHPLDERFWALLMLALYRSGRQADAIRAYQQARHQLLEGLGIEPGEELVDLEHRILAHDPTLGALPAPVALTSAPNPGPDQEPRTVVTLLFTDIEGSTRLWADCPDEMPGALEHHDALLDEAVARHGGRVVKRTGDGVDAAFFDTSAALRAAVDTQLALVGTAWSTSPPVRARMAIHLVPVLERDGDYFGMPPNMAARLRDAGHGGQTLLSDAAVREIGDQVPDDVRLVSLGVHRLRGIPGEHRIYQVLHPDLPERFPPLRTLDPAAAVAVPATSFCGRDDELATLSTLVERPGTVTLVGPGGVGKTRLAVEVAAEAGHRYRDGVRMVDLAPIGAEAVPAAMAAALGLARRGQRSFRESILDWLSRHHTLVVVDNCEHVLGVVSPLVRQVAETGPEVTVLCTSRQPLGFPGEVVFPVEPLGLPSSDAAGDLDSAPAVRLFVDRAAAARIGHEIEPDQLKVVAQICRRLDGIPLAVELAAARARSIGLHDLLAHLRSTSPLLAMPLPDHPRHRTLMTTIAWSYDLLSPGSRALFDRLSVFSGSWTVEAAHTVCADDVSVEDVLAGLADLVDRSMIIAEHRQPETRYRMLSTLREFAADRLAGVADTEERRARHARFYADLAGAAEPGLRSPEEATWVRQLNADFGNMRAAHLWAMENADVDLDARLLVALWEYGLQRLSAEYFRWVEEAFEYLRFDDHPLAADLAGVAALGAWQRGDLGQCMRSCQAAFGAEQRSGSGARLPARLAIVVAAAYSPPAGDPELAPIAAEAPSRFLEIVAWSRGLDDPYWLVYSLANGAHGMVLAGDLDRATKLAGRALAAARRSGCPTSIAWALFAMATVMAEQANMERSEALLEECVRLARSVDSRLVLGLSTSLLATLRRRLGRPLQAIPLLLDLLDHWDRLGVPPQLWHSVRESAMCLGLLGADETAVRLLAAMDQAELVMPLLPTDRADPDRAWVTGLGDQLRDRLGDAAYAAARIAGADLNREAATALATRRLGEVWDRSPQPP